MLNTVIKYILNVCLICFSVLIAIDPLCDNKRELNYQQNCQQKMIRNSA